MTCRHAARLIAIGLLTLGAVPAAAHDMWLQPRSFAQAAPGPAPTSALVGHGGDRQRWAVDVGRVKVLRSVGPSGSVDHGARLRQAGLGQDLVVQLATPGAHVIVLESRHAQSVLPAKRFNDYLKQEGLTPAIARREAGGQSTRPGEEIYSRRAKALVQVGVPTTADNAVLLRPVGLSLEIVPEANPYLPGLDRFPVRVIFEGRPLPGALVKLTNLDFDGRPVATHLTDRHGRAVFAMPKSGVWLLNVVWTKPIIGDSGADFDTTFSSLTFGFPRGNPGP